MALEVKQEYIPAQNAAPQDPPVPAEQQHQRPSPLAERMQQFDRANVNLNIHTVYDRLGGVEAHAEWAAKNPDKFYPAYHREGIPANSPLTQSRNELTIRHSVPISPLDSDDGH